MCAGAAGRAQRRAPRAGRAAAAAAAAAAGGGGRAAAPVGPRRHGQEPLHGEGLCLGLTGWGPSERPPYPGRAECQAPRCAQPPLPCLSATLERPPWLTPCAQALTLCPNGVRMQEASAREVRRLGQEVFAAWKEKFKPSSSSASAAGGGGGKAGAGAKPLLGLGIGGGSAAARAGQPARPGAPLRGIQGSRGTPGAVRR